jgi:hypothetical protein
MSVALLAGAEILQAYLEYRLALLQRPNGFIKDAHIPGITGTQSIKRAGAVTPWGVFHTIPLH